MRNLKKIEHSTVRHSQDLPLTAITWDTNTTSLICAFGPYAGKPFIRLQKWRAIGKKAGEIDADFRTIVSWDVPSPSPDLVVDRVLSLQHFGDDGTICLVFEGGDVVLVREERPSGQEEVEIVGSVDTGISAARWSPDEELLALLTKAGNVMFMTRHFDSVGETAMKDDDLASSKHVSVGWGSAATQFKGKRAKALQDPTIPQKVDEGRLSPCDKGQFQISWRGDGAFVAVSSISTSKSRDRRVIRVYDRECKLDSVSEPVDGLEGALSWRPAGNLIASIQRFNDHIDVVFFERNGLRHGEFTLQISPEGLDSWATTIDLAWNTDSTVLAVSYQDRIQLWTMGNYHYYLKQEIHVPAKQKWPLYTSVTWNPSLPLRLAISSPEVLVATGFASVTEAGSAASPYDSGAVAVIDGNSIKLTALRYANVPPPMASLEPAVPSAVLDVALSQSGCLLATLRSDALDVLEWNPKDPETEHVQRGSLRFPHDDSLSAFLQVAFLGETSIFCLRANSTEYTVRKVGLDVHTLELGEYVYRGETALTRIFPRSDHGSLCIVESAARVWELEPQAPYNPVKICQFPEPAVWVEAVHWQEKTIAFGLSASGYLYANKRLLSKQVTSFRATPAHLIFTTAQHFLKFAHAAAVDDLAVPGDDPEQDERCRMIERGARLVSVIPATSAVVLQMPRGNLETVYPRALVVARIRDCIGSKDYSTAFQICRVQRVDLNILHDYAPSQFLNNLGLFVDQVQKVDYIDQFLSQLKEEDVTQTAYKTTLPISPSGAQEGEVTERPSANGDTTGRNQKRSKVNSICDAILPVLASRMPKHLQNMVTVHLSKSPPDMEAALLLVVKLKAEHPELVERAVEHICFLADVNRLFDNALGLYNLELALLIAQQSQKDPREYLPFLQNLQQMQPLRRQFVIDNHLGRFTKALNHLHALQSFGEMKEYTIRHELYKEALALYKYEDDKFDGLMALFAEHLEGRSQFKEAGIAFEFVGQYQKALESYRAAGCWREALYCAAQANVAQPQVQALARSFADSLYESKDFLNAARLYIDYGNDVEMAARTYCKGYLFAEAMRLIKSHGEDAFLGSVVDTGLGEAMAESTELLAECKTQINAQVPRLRELRTKRDEDPLAYYEGTAPEDVPDNVSLAPTDMSTSASLFTRYTNRTGGTMNTHTTRNTSKNRRREERKRARGKKGSVYEEEYLVNSLRRLIERVNSVRDDIARLVEALVRRRMWERAVAVEKAMLDMVDLCKACLGEVFVAAGEDQQTAGAGHTAATLSPTSIPAVSTAHGDDAETGSREYGRGLSALVPVVLPFERLSLI